MKKGIAKIEGPTFPQVEDRYIYKVTEWYNGVKTIPEQDINWVLYKLVNGREWKEVKGIKKTGPIINVSFSQQLYGEKLLLEAYAKSPEKKSPPGLIIIPLAGAPKLLKAEILDEQGQAITRSMNYGEKVMIRLFTRGLMGKHVTLSLWDEDKISDDLLWGKTKIKVDQKSGVVERIIVLSSAMRSAGGTYGNNGVHKYYLLAEADGLEDIKSSIVTVNIDTPKVSKVSKGNSGATTGQADNKNEGNKNECPRCKKLTKEEAQKVFPEASEVTILSIVKEFNNFCDKFEVNTCLLKAHFFAQAKQESGNNLVPAMDGENMNYSVSGLLATGFQNVSSSHTFGNFNGIDMAKKLGRQPGAPALSFEAQIKVANFVYGLNPKAATLGNKAPSDNFSLSENDNEGWRYRGRGTLQITGKDNYTDIEDTVNKKLGNNELNIKNGRKGKEKFTPKEALLSGFGDWYLHKMFVPAKGGCTEEACRKVIKIINSKTKSKTKRVAHLLGGKWYVDDNTKSKAFIIQDSDCMKTIFRVEECKNHVILKKDNTSKNCVCKKEHIDLRSSIKWQTQFDPQWGDAKAQNVACWKTSHQILVKSGLPDSSGYSQSAIQLALEVDNHTTLKYIKEGVKEGVTYLDSELEKGHPVLIGVNHDLNYHGEKNVDHTTDHFVVVVGRACDTKPYYLFYDVGTKFENKGASDSNRLYVEEDRIIGKTAYNANKNYTVSQIRLNK